MNKPIRILQVTGIMNRGGAETMIMNIYRNIDKSKIQFDFVENSLEVGAFDSEIIELGGNIYRCSHYNGKNHFQYKKWWINFFEKHKGEYLIIHGHIGSTAAIYLGIAKKYGLYTIAHSHSEMSFIDKGGKLYSIFSFPTRYIADYFFGCSMKAGISRFGRKIAESEKFQVIKNAINISEFSFDLQKRNIIRNEFNISNEFVIGHVGRMDDNKNQIFILKLMEKMVKMGENVKLILVGNGINYNSLKKKAFKLGISETVIFTGVRSDVNLLMQGMDCFVFPSFYEGLPVTLIEAQAAGLPCIVSDTITREVGITNLIHFISLKSPDSEWINKILEFHDYKRNNNPDLLNNSEYNIKKNVLSLEEFYLERSK